MKAMPMPKKFAKRFLPQLSEIVAHFGTPFHIYDEVGIRSACLSLIGTFPFCPGFREFFAVKACPNPRIMEIILSTTQELLGFDCSSIPELQLARQIGARPEQIMFTSNNTSHEEFVEAMAYGGCILNLDDITLIDKVPGNFPDLICFRYNPGDRRTGNMIIGNPLEAKYGVKHEQILVAYEKARRKGATRFGLHTMLASNERNVHYHVATVKMLLKIAEALHRDLDIDLEFINMGGGLGIPYHPRDASVDLFTLGQKVTQEIIRFTEYAGYIPKLYMENGRYVTGPHGVLVTKCINQKHGYREYRGVDACMSALMRPAIYNAYHHITVHGSRGRRSAVVDVVGSLCENNDKFAIQRKLPVIREGDILLIHDAGAHGYAMGFNYNGRVRPQELLLREDGSVELIRRAETAEDLFRTLQFEPNILSV